MRLRSSGRWWLIALLPFVCLAFGLRHVAAQEDRCRALVEQALIDLERNCATTPAGSACYGHDFIAATFREETDFFHPTDRAPAADLLSLRSSHANLSTGDWGIAQLNLPVDLGEVAGVDAQTGLTLMVLGQAALLNLRLGPDAAPPELSFRGEPHNAPCEEATNALILHSARGLLTKMSVNGVVLDFDGSIIAQQPAVDIITFIVAEGELVSQNLRTAAGQALSILLNDEGVAQAFIPTREASEREQRLFEIVARAVAAARGEGPAALDAPPAAEEAEAPPEETVTTEAATGADEAAATVTEAEPVAEEPEAVLATTEGDTVADPEASDAVITLCQEGQLVRHTIVSGETLFAIAQSYNSSVADIVAQNTLADADLIQIGQELVIPCDSREPGETTMGNLSTGNPSPGERDDACASMSLSSDFSGESMRTFRWSAVSGATNYVVTLSQEGLEIARYQSVGPGTSLTAALPGGSDAPFTWTVAAWQGEAVLCSSGSATIDDGNSAVSEPVSPAPLGPVSFTWTCLSPGQIALTWSNVPQGTERITITYRNREGTRKQTLGVPGQSGRLVLAETYTADGEVTLAPQGTGGALSPPEIYCS